MVIDTSKNLPENSKIATTYLGHQWLDKAGYKNNRLIITAIKTSLLLFSIVFLLLLFSSTTYALSLNAKAPIYELSWDGNSSTIKVDITYYTASPKNTFAFINDIGNQKNIFRSMHIIKVNDDDKITIDSIKRELTITHNPSTALHFSYEFDGHLNINIKNAIPNELFKPIIESGVLRAKAINFLMKIKEIQAEDIMINWKQIPEDLPYFVSILPDATTKSVLRVKEKDFNDLIFFMGKDLIIKTHAIRHDKYYEITSSRDTINKMQTALKPFFDVFFPRAYDFWQDDKSGPYFLFSAPFYTPEQKTNSGYAAGKHGFVMIYQGKYTLNNTMIVAHETSHRWIGGELRITEHGDKYTWFSEGVNDYITYFLLAGSAMINKEEFVSEANKNRFEALYKNPVNALPADSISKHFWDGYDYIQLSYQRGFLYGFVLDNQIRIASKGKKTMRDFLLLLLEKQRLSRNKEITYNDFIEVGSYFIPKEIFKKDVEEHMIKGTLYDFSKIKLINGYRINYKNGIPSLEISPDTDIKQIYS
ncbi:hypothetical protein [Pedobacter aquatilis]|uniref:hypothetical protein n=1 Tax=Pedobacter aquatilis TaxID=351343 RepID=UPI00292D472C|nr:hypothetical protein [Pedobacter aquatilis]